MAIEWGHESPVGSWLAVARATRSCARTSNFLGGTYTTGFFLPRLAIPYRMTFAGVPLWVKFTGLGHPVKRKVRKSSPAPPSCRGLAGHAASEVMRRAVVTCRTLTPVHYFISVRPRPAP